MEGLRIPSSAPVRPIAASDVTPHERPVASRVGWGPVAPTTKPLALPEPRPFDPSYGYTLEQLRQTQPPMAPADFQQFWRERYQRALGVPVQPTIGPARRVGAFDVSVIHYNGLDGKRLGGYLVLPANDGAVDNAVVYGHGYGGCSAPDASRLSALSPTSAALFVCVRGFGLSADAAIPGDANKHVVHGIENRDTYAVGTSVEDIWSSTNALLAVAPGGRQRLYYDGTSFGGGVGALALAQDTRFAKAVLEVPTFGHQPLRMTLQTNGSGQAVRRFLARSEHPQQVMRVLSYYTMQGAPHGSFGRPRWSSPLKQTPPLPLRASSPSTTPSALRKSSSLRALATRPSRHAKLRRLRPNAVLGSGSDHSNVTSSPPTLPACAAIQLALRAMVE